MSDVVKNQGLSRFAGNEIEIEFGELGTYKIRPLTLRDFANVEALEKARRYKAIDDAGLPPAEASQAKRSLIHGGIGVSALCEAAEDSPALALDIAKCAVTPLDDDTPVVLLRQLLDTAFLLSGLASPKVLSRLPKAAGGDSTPSEASPK